MKTENYRSKIMNREEIASRLKSVNGKTVFTNGCFDLLHIGHIRYLYEASLEGDLLIIGINTDSSVKKIKGPGRPITPEKERAELISALEFVDYVTLFSETLPTKTLDIIKPDVHVKGGDYKIDDIPETETVEKNGGKVKILGLYRGYSSSSLIKKIKNI